MNHHKFLRTAVALLGLLGAACTSDSDPGTVAPADGGDGGNASPTCWSGQDLPGASYDLSKSRFAFGSTPVREDADGLVRWVGSQGVIAIAANGSVGALSTGGSPALDRPSFSLDADVVTAHLRAYFKAMGVPDCQVQDVGISSGSSGPVVGAFVATILDAALVRGIDGIVIAESQAWADFTVDDQTTYEGFFWPAIPASVVSGAIAFRDQLKDPQQLADYKAKLPAGAQGDGIVAIHHSPPFSSSATVKAIVTYDTGIGPSPVSFDTSGTQIAMPFDP
jgi:hypothetical protein